MANTLKKTGRCLLAAVLRRRAGPGRESSLQERAALQSHYGQRSRPLLQDSGKRRAIKRTRHKQQQGVWNEPV